MMGIPVNNPCFVYGDNQSVLYNTTLPDLVLKKKSRSARKEWKTSYIKTGENPADVMTKSLPAGEDRKRNIRNIQYDIY